MNAPYFIDNLRSQVTVFYPTTGQTETSTIVNEEFVLQRQRHEISSLPHLLSVIYDVQFIDCATQEDWEQQVQQLKNK